MTFPEFSIIWVDLVLGLLNTSRFTYANAVIRSKVFDSYAAVTNIMEIDVGLDDKDVRT